MKIITAIIAFTTTFGTSTALTGLFVEKQHSSIAVARTNGDCKTQQRILSLLRQDIKNGEERLDKYSQTVDFGEVSSLAGLGVYSKAVSEYSDESASIDDTNLPSDFQRAWRRHMKAWHEYSVHLDQLKKSAETQNMTVDEIVEQLNDQNDLINLTWYKALAVADKYGADPYENE
jgi:hypothetical protein